MYAGIAKRNRTQDRLLEHLTIKKEKINGVTKVKIAQFSNLENTKKAEKSLLNNLNLHLISKINNLWQNQIAKE